MRQIFQRMSLCGLVVALMSPSPIVRADGPEVCLVQKGEVIKVDPEDVAGLLKLGAKPVECPPSRPGTSLVISPGSARTINTGPPDLEIKLTHDPETVVAGQALTVLVLVRNTGGEDASDVNVRYVVPTLELTNEPALFTSVSGDHGFQCAHLREPAPAHVDCEHGTLDERSSARIELQLVAPLQGGTISSGATVDPGNSVSESDEGNNTAASIATVLGRPDFRVSIAEPLRWGGVPPACVFFCAKGFSIPVTVTNSGESSASTLVMVRLPDGVTFGDAENPCPDGMHLDDTGSRPAGPGRLPLVTACVENGPGPGSVECRIPELGPGDSALMMVNVGTGLFGQGVIRAEADWTHRVDERGEGNNSASFTWKW